MNRYILRMLALKKCNKPEEDATLSAVRDGDPFATSLMESSDFKAYISKHGYHFSDKLAEWASAHLNNKDQSSHRWKVEEVKAAVTPLMNVTVKHGSWGDLAYSANYAYAVLHPTVLKDESACIKYAIIIDTDSNHQMTVVFDHFISDVIAKHQVIPWGEVI